MIKLNFRELLKFVYTISPDLCKQLIIDVYTRLTVLFASMGLLKEEPTSMIKEAVSLKDEIMNFVSQNNSYFSSLSKTIKPAYNFFKRNGGKNPIVKGLATNLNTTSGNPLGYSPSDNNIDLELRKNGYSELADNILNLAKSKGNSRSLQPNDEAVSFYTKYPTIARGYSDMFYDGNNNYALGNLDKIIKEVKANNIHFTPNISYPNNKFRNDYVEAFKELTGFDIREASNLSVQFKSNLNFLKNYEIAIPCSLNKIMDPKCFHLFDSRLYLNPNKASKIILNNGISMQDLKNQNIKTFINNLRNMDNLKTIPLDNYVEGSSFLQSFLKNMENKGSIKKEDLSYLYEINPSSRGSGYADPIHRDIFYDLIQKARIDEKDIISILPFIR